MNENESKILEDYVVKMLEVQKQQFEKPLSLPELREIAYSVGMSETDWQASQEQMQKHLNTGQGHLQNNNWKDAIKELKQAVAINPFHEAGLYGLAKAHYELYKDQGKSEDQQAAVDYADRALKNEDNHFDAATIALLNNIRHAEASHQKKKRSFWLRIAAAASVVVVLFAAVFFISSSTMSQKAEKVDQQWAQVENVYQRRADLIPKVVNLVKAASEYDQAKLDKLSALQKNIQSSDKKQFMQQQEELGDMLNQVLVDLQGNSTMFRDLQVQIEGAENRISVERKKYNDAISHYNNAANSFPNKLFGFKKKAYYKSEALQKNPDLKFN